MEKQILQQYIEGLREEGREGGIKGGREGGVKNHARAL